MTRSRRKYPACSNTTSGHNRGEHDDKKRASRRFRRLVRALLDSGVHVMPLLREISNPWQWRKDGKNRFQDERYLRK
jgi:hypothetical protein